MERAGTEFKGPHAGRTNRLTQSPSLILLRKMITCSHQCVSLGLLYTNSTNKTMYFKYNFFKINYRLLRIAVVRRQNLAQRVAEETERQNAPYRTIPSSEPLAKQALSYLRDATESEMSQNLLDNPLVLGPSNDTILFTSRLWAIMMTLSFPESVD